MTLAALAAGVLALGAAAPAVSAAAGPCVATVPAARSAPDVAGDDPGGPDVRSLDVALDGACRLTVSLAVTAPTAGDAYGYWLDTDDNAQTGSLEDFKGTDYFIGRDPGQPPELFRETSGGREAVKQLAPVGSDGALVSVDDLGAVAGTPIAVRGGVIAFGANPGQVFSDFAPDTPDAALLVPFAFPPTPPAPPAPAPPAPAPGPGPAAGSTGGPTLAVNPRPLGASQVGTTGARRPSCRVPVLTGLTLTRARARLTASHCRLGRLTRRTSRAASAGRVLGSTPRRGTVLAGGARVGVVLGRRASRTHRPRTG